MSGSAASRRYLFALYAVLLVFYGGWVTLWFAHPTAYARLLGVYDVQPVVTAGLPRGAAPVPFFDLVGVVSWSECARMGVDVYAQNPCDPYHRVANYSPLLVDLPLQWIGVRHAGVAGFVLDLAFLLLLPFVFRPRSWGGVAVAAAAATSHATFYALERANIDIVVFLAIAAAALVSQKTLRGRLWLYSAALAGALVKFYPLVLGLLAIRERLRVLLTAALIFLAVMSAFAWWYWPELLRVTHNLPYFHYLSDMFGAGALPNSLAWAWHWPYGTVRPIKLVLVAGLLWFAVRASARWKLPVENWGEPDQLLLLCGAVVMVSCFLLQTNNSYRAIFLMFTLPGLMSLRRSLGRIMVWAVICTLGCLWAEVARAAVTHWKALAWTLFLVREVLWWFEAAVLSGLILCFVRQAPAVKEALRRLGLAQTRPLFDRLES